MGRGKDNVLVLTDPGVSTHHFEIRPHDKAFVLFDLNSKNGTYINDQRVTEKILADGDILGFGKTRIYVGILDQP